MEHLPNKVFKYVQQILQTEEQHMNLLLSLFNITIFGNLLPFQLLCGFMLATVGCYKLIYVYLYLWQADQYLQLQSLASNRRTILRNSPKKPQIKRNSFLEQHSQKGKSDCGVEAWFIAKLVIRPPTYVAFVNLPWPASLPAQETSENTAKEIPEFQNNRIRPLHIVRPNRHVMCCTALTSPPTSFCLLVLPPFAAADTPKHLLDPQLEMPLAVHKRRFQIHGALSTQEGWPISTIHNPVCLVHPGQPLCFCAQVTHDGAPSH